MLTEIAKASLIGGVLFLLLCGFRRFTKARFSYAFHYYASLVPLAFFFGAGAVFSPIIASINSHFAQKPMLVLPDNIADIRPPVNLSFASAIAADVTADAVSKAKDIMEGIDFAFLSQLLFAVWAVGTVAFLLFKCISYYRFKNGILRSCENIGSEYMQKGVKILTSGVLTTPMLMGFFKPVILLPDIKMNEEELRLVILHELTHVKRRDLIFKFIVLISNAIHWFNPLSYMLTRKINLLCENSCDERLVAKMDMKARGFYGKLILETLERGKTSALKQNSFSVAFAGNKKNMEGRLINIMTFKKPCKKTAILSGAIVVFIGILGAGLAYSYNCGAELTPTQESPVKVIESCATGKRAGCGYRCSAGA